MTERKQGKNGSYLDLYPESEYDPTVYERPTATVDICIFRFVAGNLQVLWIERGQEPYKGMLAFPGGFIDIANGESADVAALRELHEETGLSEFEGIPQQFKTYASRNRDPRWYTIDIVYYHVLSPDDASKLKPVAGDDAASASWVNVSEALEYDLAFDHAIILKELTDFLYKSFGLTHYQSGRYLLHKATRV